MAAPFRRLPPVGALLVLEAAGRHLNFSRAALELGLTQSAVSHGIRALETRLGVTLFRRLHRGVALTAAGAQLLDAASQGLGILQEAAAALRRRGGASVLRVLTDFGFAAWWLMSRLGSWSERAPGVEVRIITAQHVPDLRQEDADIAILFGSGSWPACRAERWFPETVYPVCSPGVAAGLGSDPQAALGSARLLHVSAAEPCEWLTWPRYLQARRTARAPRTQDLSFGNYQLVLQAALLGQGVALGWRPLIDELVLAGQILRLSETPLMTDAGYYLVEPLHRAHPPVVADFRRWLLAQREECLGRWPLGPAGA
ncbi:MAG: LysR family transcriptional regulator [Gammaproteobacteria bacterium]|nr:LysR family transcriptional regulator [Gammaproteobacteria bacterium]